MPQVDASFEIVSHKGWARNVRLSNAEVELIVTLDVGPRILHYGFRGGRNVFCEIPEQLGKANEKTWRIRGGHRLWIAPEQKPLTYEPDNGPVEFEEIAGGIRTIQSPGPLTGVRKTLDITLAASGTDVTVAHGLINESKTPVTCAPWALSVMTPGGTAVIPLPPRVSHDDCVVPNQTWSLWSYTALSDPRFRIGSRCLRIAQDTKREATKFGLAQREGWSAYVLPDAVFIKRFRWQDGGSYPDGNVNFEVFTDEKILELETLGPLVTLKPGQFAQHEEQWSLHPGGPDAAGDEAKLFKALAPLV